MFDVPPIELEATDLKPRSSAVLVVAHRVIKGLSCVPEFGQGTEY